MQDSDNIIIITYPLIDTPDKDARLAIGLGVGLPLLIIISMVATIFFIICCRKYCRK